MSEKDKKLDFDLGFLDEESPKPKQPIRKESPEATSSIKWNWKTISIIAGVIIVIVWIASSEDSTTSTSTYTPPSTNQVRNVSADEDSVIYGEYRCSRYHYDKAVALSPSETEQTLKSAQSSMDLRASELDRLERELKYSYVTEYSSQYEIDDYNAKVNTYNSKLTSYKRDVTALDSRIDRFNTQVAAHNNYLIQNCTPR
jgi:peptidoglycan hydrolase CwlO-like protein